MSAEIMLKKSGKERFTSRLIRYTLAMTKESDLFFSSPKINTYDIAPINNGKKT